MDNAPSGALLINMSDGRWEMEARWVLKVAMMVGDWKEPLYTCIQVSVSQSQRWVNYLQYSHYQFHQRCPM